MSANERSIAPRQSWCAMLFCPRTTSAKQTVTTERSATGGKSVATEGKSTATEGKSTAAENKEKNTANWVEEVTALKAASPRQALDNEKNTANEVETEASLTEKASDDTTPTDVSDNVNDDIVRENVNDVVSNNDNPTYSSPVKEILSTLGEDISTTDEEYGILAMFKHIHEKFPDLDTAPAQAYMTAAFAGLVENYTKTVQNVNEHEITRDLAETDEEYGMTAMFRELGEKFPDMPATDANAYINAMLAQLLHVYYSTALKASKVPAILHCNTDVVELNEDVGPHAMLKEVASHFPGMSSSEVQQLMLGRFTELSNEAEERKAEF
jgi:hypothetical protein